MWANADEPTYGACGLTARLSSSATWWLTAVEALDATLRQARVAELELEVRDDRGEVGVAGPLAEPVQRPLDVAGAGVHRGHRVGDGTSGVVVAVDADRDVTAHVGVDHADDLLDLVRQRAAIGVAEHDMARALHHRRLQRPHENSGLAL